MILSLFFAVFYIATCYYQYLITTSTTYAYVNTIILIFYMMAYLDQYFTNNKLRQKIKKRDDNIQSMLFVAKECMENIISDSKCALATISDSKEIVFDTKSHIISVPDEKKKAMLMEGATLDIPNGAKFTIRASTADVIALECPDGHPIHANIVDTIDLEITNGHTIDGIAGFRTCWSYQKNTNVSPVQMSKSYSVAFHDSNDNPNEFTLLPGTKYVMIINGVRCALNGHDIVNELSEPVSALLIK